MPMDDGRNYGSREWNPWNVQSDIAIIHDAYDSVIIDEQK
jgi:hypothetical protein